jgi:hypothetical protein
MNRLDMFRALACLAHTVPGLTLQGSTTKGQMFTVSRQRLGADMSPCEFRAAVVSAGRTGWPRLHEAITDLDVVGGAVELGGGLYQPTHPGAGDARWFVTFLEPSVVQHSVASCPLDVNHDDLDVSIRADTDLGTCAVRCTAGPTRRLRLDEAASWLLAVCLSEELLASSDAHVPP